MQEIFKAKVHHRIINLLMFECHQYPDALQVHLLFQALDYLRV